MTVFVVKSMFFDRQRVLNAAHKAKLRNLNSSGGMIKVTEQRLMRYANRASKPGEAPRSHKPNAYLRKRTYYGYDKSSDSVVIGPEKLNVSKTAGGTVPEILEFGGDTVIKEVQLGGGLWKEASVVPASQQIGRPTRLRKVHIEPRPFAAPALQANLPKLSGLWANSIRE